MPDAVAFTDILVARRRIAGHVHRTVQRPSQALTARFGHEILLKCEHQQLTGAFKLRGATNALLALPEPMRARGVCAASTGNHGRALSHAARSLGTRAIICMSGLVPANKVAAIEALGAEARIVGRSQDDAQIEVDRLVAEEGMAGISPFDMADVIAGQGTIGLEIMEDTPDLEAVLVPLSGGGLFAGIARAVKTVNPNVRMIGISMERGAAMAQSLAAGRPVEIEEVATLADSLGGGIGLKNRFTFGMVREMVDDVITLTEREIAEAVGYAYLEESEVLEGAAAVGIGALLSGRFVPRGKTALVLSGKNIDIGAHRQIVERTHPAFENDPEPTRQEA